MLAEMFFAVMNDLASLIVGNRFAVDIFFTINKPLMVNDLVQAARVAGYSSVLDVRLPLSGALCLHLKSVTSNYAFFNRDMNDAFSAAALRTGNATLGSIARHVDHGATIAAFNRPCLGRHVGKRSE